jgi:hypothetical protein
MKSSNSITVIKKGVCFTRQDVDVAIFYRVFLQKGYWTVLGTTGVSDDNQIFELHFQEVASR